MAFEPQKLFISLVSFFSVLLPGALLAYLGMDWIAETFVARGVYGREGWEEWLVFLFVAYLLGHIVFLLGSTLDDLLYAPVRDATVGGQVRTLARGGRLAHPRLRRLASSRWLFGRNADAAVLQAQRIRSEDLAAEGAGAAINAYQWAKVRLAREHPEALTAVERVEADSKFFRSFAVVLLLLTPVFLWNLRIVAALLCAALVVPALWRYAEQRFKGTQLAYWHLLGLRHAAGVTRGPAGERGEPAGDRMCSARISRDGFTHAGGVVFRKGAAEAEFLLVESSAGGEWVLPRGHIERWENAAEAAVREVLEEAGMWARVVAPAGEMDFEVGGTPVAVRLYVMEALEQVPAGSEGTEGRRLRWLPAGAAIAAATHEETRRALAAAETLRAHRRRGRLDEDTVAVPG